MVSTISSMAILISANVAPAMKSMDQVGNKVKDVGQTSQKEGAKTEGFMKKWAGSFAAIGAAATASLYMVVKASPLLAGAMQEAQDAISLLFMTIGDALEPILRPFVDVLWDLSNVIIDMPGPLNALVAGFVAFGGSITAVLAGLALLPAALHAVGLASGAAASHVLLLSTAFFGIVTVAGLVAAVLYAITEDPTTAIIAAFTTIGVGASTLLHHPVIAATTALIGGFALLVTASENLEIAVGLAFVGIGIVATALMGHPVFAAGVGIAALFIAWGKASEDAKGMIEVAMIGMAAVMAAFMGHPVIAAFIALVATIRAAIGLYREVKAIMGDQVRTPSWFPVITPGVGEEYPAGWHQHGGYVPYTGPAFLHAGEYVVPAGRVGSGVGGGAIYNVTNNFEINNPILGSDMDIDRLKARLDELYKREMGMTA